MTNRSLISSIVLAAALAACTPTPETLFAEAQTAISVNDYNTARVALIAGLNEQPNNADMLVLLSQSQIALGDGEGAAVTLERLPAAMQNEPRIALMRGEAEVLKGRFDEAITMVGAIETSGADRVRALAYIGLGQFGEAAEAFATGSARTAADARLLTSYARFELARGDTQKASDLIAKALETDGSLVEAFLVRGRILERNNQLPGALAAFDKALKLHPGNFDGRLGKAHILASLGRSEDASELVRQLQREDPSSPGVAIVKARIEALENNWQNVRDILQPYEAQLRSDPQAIALYGETLIELDLHALALNFLMPEFERQPGWRKLRRLVARAQLGADEAAEALATIRPLASRADATPQELELAAQSARASGNSASGNFERRIDEISPEWVGGELAKADQALRNRQWRAAERSYEAIIARLRASNAMVLNNLAFAQERLGKQEEALENALAAVRLEPDNPSVLDTAGWLLVQTGSKARGLEMLQRAAVMAPDNVTIARHLSDAQAR